MCLVFTGAQMLGTIGYPQKLDRAKKLGDLGVRVGSQGLKSHAEKVLDPERYTQNTASEATDVSIRN